MQDPQSGAVERLTSEEISRIAADMGALRSVKNAVHARMALKSGVDVGPAENLVVFSEGEVLEIRGAFFRVIHMRPSRISLKPISRREAGQ